MLGGEFRIVQPKKGGLTASQLKLIAILAMLIDHIATVFVGGNNPLGVIMHFIGRITGPVMFYFVVEGYHYTRNVNRYTLRLVLFAIISYIPYIYCFDEQLPNKHNFMHLNVIYTICVGLLVLRAKYEIKNPFIRRGIIIILFFISLFGDWSFLAPLIIFWFDKYRGNFKQQMTAYFFTILFMIGIVFIESAWRLTTVLIQLGMILPILLLYFYNGEKGKGNKWAFYVFYPLHLILLGLLHYAFIK